MNGMRLKEAMNQVHMKEEMQEAIIRNVKKQTEQKVYKWKKRKKAAVAAAAIALVAGAAIPIQAGIRYLVKDRLEDIPKQELEAVNQMLQDQSGIQADSFTREYSTEERKRMRQLEEAYQNGRFPKQAITFVSRFEQVPDDSLCYGLDTGIFYLPERTLTDEELLQMIDFHYTTDYALAQGTAAQEAKEAQKAKESRLKEEVQEKGGLTEQEALRAADKYLQTEFGLQAEGMERDFFLDELEQGIMIYHVRYETQDDTYIYAYGIDINAEDGSLVDISDSSLRKERDLETAVR